MAGREDRKGPCEELEAAFLAPKIPLEGEKSVQHSFFSFQSIRTFCNQEPLSGPWRTNIHPVPGQISAKLSQDNDK